MGSRSGLLIGFRSVALLGVSCVSYCTDWKDFNKIATGITRVFLSVYWCDLCTGFGRVLHLYND